MKFIAFVGKENPKKLHTLRNNANRDVSSDVWPLVSTLVGHATLMTSLETPNFQMSLLTSSPNDSLLPVYVLPVYVLWIYCGYWKEENLLFWAALKRLVFQNLD